ncbi:MAG: hypothetical protein V1766_05420 [Pseudomonadota bacterium]
MQQECYRYVKGHCGWDSVTLLYGEEIPEGEEHRIAHTLFEPPCSGGVEIGFLYPPKGEENVRLRIIDSTTRTWLPMCGGMSQVIGLAAFNTSLQDKFNIAKRLPSSRIDVLTDSGLVPIEVTFDGDRVGSVTTHMADYARFLYQDGVHPVTVRGIPAMKIGYFLVFKMDDLKRAYPEMEFGHRRPGPPLELLGAIQQEYLHERHIEASTLYSMIYDLHPEDGGNARIFTRFFKGKGVPQSTPLEAQCGTGTIAVGIAMAEKGELPFTGARGRVVFEWGSQHLTQDPYGARKSFLDMELVKGRIVWAGFGHNVVELQSEGAVYLPSFQHKLF